jgi:hypothetical protein
VIGGSCHCGIWTVANAIGLAKTGVRKAGDG